MCGCIEVSGAGTLVDQDEIHRMAQSEDVEERIEAVKELQNNFTFFSDTNQAWEDIHRLIQDNESNVRWRAAEAFGIIFPLIHDKKQAWRDLHRLVSDEDSNVRWHVAETIGTVLPFVPSKKQAWKDLIQLAHDNNMFVKVTALLSLGPAFYYISDKEQGWEVLPNLVKSNDRNVRLGVGISISVAFSYIPDKKQAWEDLNLLLQDEDRDIRLGVTMYLGNIFPYIHDKKHAEKELHKLTKEDDRDIKFHAAKSIGVAFSHIPDKKQAWEDLKGLAQDKDSILQISANYSLGKISIFKATECESEKDFKNELEKALEFFEISTKEPTYNPAKFCLPFYQSFYAITFKKYDSETEVQKYLAKAKIAIEGSRSRKILLEAVEDLANALRDAQKTQEVGSEAIKRDLNAYRRYLERAADLLSETEEKAPGASKLIRKGLPIIDQKIKEIIAEIQENAKALCKQTKDTPLEDLGKEVNCVSQTFPQIRDPIGLEKGFINLSTVLSSICAKMPEEERGEACKLLKKAGDEPYIEDKLPLINMVLSKISSQISAAKNIETVEKKLDSIMISLMPGIREELVISVGAEFGGTGAQHIITIPLQDISYPDLKKDLGKINGRGILKLSSLPAKLAENIKSYLVRNKKDDLLYRK